MKLNEVAARTDVSKLRLGDTVDVGGIPMTIGHIAHGPRPAVLATTDGRGVAWDTPCQSLDADDREEILCIDLLSGACYWMCFFCRGVVGAAHA